jgi:hypothetical protein
VAVLWVAALRQDGVPAFGQIKQADLQVRPTGALSASLGADRQSAQL